MFEIINLTKYKVKSTIIYANKTTQKEKEINKSYLTVIERN